MDDPKVELNLKQSVASANGNDNTDSDSNNIIFTIKGTNLYVPIVTLSTKDNLPRDLMNFNEISGENVTYDDIQKMTKKQSFTLSSDNIFFEVYSQD